MNRAKARRERDRKRAKEMTLALFSGYLRDIRILTARKGTFINVDTTYSKKSDSSNEIPNIALVKYSRVIYNHKRFEDYPSNQGKS